MYMYVTSLQRSPLNQRRLAVKGYQLPISKTFSSTTRISLFLRIHHPIHTAYMLDNVHFNKIHANFNTARKKRLFNGGISN